MENVKGFVNFLFRNSLETPEVIRKKEMLTAELVERVKKHLDEGLDDKQALEAAIDGFDDLFNYVLEENEAASVHKAVEVDQPLFPEPENEVELPEDGEVEQPEVLNEDELESTVENVDETFTLKEEQPEVQSEPEVFDTSAEREEFKVTIEDEDWAIPEFDPRSITVSSEPVKGESGRKVLQYKLWFIVSLITTPFVIGLVVLLYFLLPYIPFIAQNTLENADLMGLCAAVAFLIAWPLIQYVLYAMTDDEPGSFVESPGKDIIYSFTSWLILVAIFYLFNYILMLKAISNIVWWHYCVVATFAYPLSSIVRLILLSTDKFYKE